MKFIFMPRRKYGRLIKTVEKPPNDNCSRCRAGKHCPLPGHQGNETSANRSWQGQKMSIKEIIRKILLVNNHSIIGALSILFPVEISSSLSFLSFSCDDCARW